MRHVGVSFVEVVSAIAILALLLALLLPAINIARESSRRLHCTNNLRQMALAVTAYDSARGKLPSLYNGASGDPGAPRLKYFHAHPWQTVTLPFLEESTLYESIDWEKAATHPDNRRAIQTRVPTFVCPSTVGADRPVAHVQYHGIVLSNHTAARSDYTATGAVQWQRQIAGDFDPRIWHNGAWGDPIINRDSQVIDYRMRSISFDDVSDGLSQTTLVAERAGRPDRYQDGRLAEQYDPTSKTSMDNHMAAWGVSTDFVWLALAHFDDNGINRSNDRGIYSFHVGGANVAFCDSSVRFVAKETDVAIVQGMITRSRRDKSD